MTYFARNRADLHVQLDQLLDQFETVEASEPLNQQVSGTLLLAEAAAFAGLLCGPETLMRIYGHAEADAPRGRKLNLLAHRLMIAAHLFRQIQSADGARIDDVALEASAVAAGDAPQLFARTSSKKSSVRVSLLQLRAWEWNYFLEGLGFPPADRHRRIAHAYGRGTDGWETIRKWDRSMKRDLGAAYLKLRLNDAAEAGFAVARGDDPPYLQWMGIGDQWMNTLAKDGQAYQAAMREKIANSTG